ncbi:MAG: hypothetical protein AB7Q97_25600 [Gammaproteobacteria bacterium]
MKRFNAIAAVVGGAFALAAAPAGATSVFFGLDNSDLSGGGARPNATAAQAAFALAAGALLTEDFESTAVGPVPSSFDIGGVTGTFTSTATSYSRIFAGVEPSYSTYPASGTHYLDSLTQRDSTYFTVDFDTPLRALGFYITDASDWAGSPPGTIANLQVTLYRGTDTEVLDLFGGLDVTTVVNANFAFFGVVDAGAPITGISIANPASNPDADAIGIDDVQIAPVPLPPAAALLLPGLALLRRRRS